MTPFLEENEQLGSALENLIDFYSHEGRALLDHWRDLAEQSHRLLFFGMGTSEFTPLLIKWNLMEAGFEVNTVDAGEWNHYGNQQKPAGFLPVLTSQSGESIEIRNLVEGKKISSPFVAVTNNQDSTLGSSAALTLPLRAGEEKTITTKTYTNNLALLYLMTAGLAPAGTVDQRLDDLKAVAVLLADTEYSDVEKAAEILRPADTLAFVARGPAIVSAKQCALTFMEGTKNVSAAFTGGAFNHGPFESVDETFRLVVFRPDGPASQLMARCAEKAAGYSAGVAVFSDSIRKTDKSIVSINLSKPDRGQTELLFPILAAPKQNRLLHLVAKSRGVEAGVFRYGSKVTGRE